MLNIPKVNLTRVFNCNAKTLFSAIGEGALFLQTTADPKTMKIDFREGGTFHLEWSDYGTGDGVFKVVKPYEKIVFTWVGFSKEKQAREFENSFVTIQINETKGKARLNLIHEGQESVEGAKDHESGWNYALDALQKQVGQ